MMQSDDVKVRMDDPADGNKTDDTSSPVTHLWVKNESGIDQDFRFPLRTNLCNQGVNGALNEG